MRYSARANRSSRRASIMADSSPVQERLLRAEEAAAVARRLGIISPIIDERRPRNRIRSLWILITTIFSIFSIVVASLWILFTTIVFSIVTVVRSIRRVALVLLSYVDLVAVITSVPLQVLICGVTLLGGLYALFLHVDGKIGQLAAFGGVAWPGRRLIADTGASMHAVGDVELLQDLELLANPKSVKMANGTVEHVLGFGRIDWGHFSIPKVYLVKGLETSLISISQLDRDHGMHSCFGQGKGEIMLADGTVVGAAFLDKKDGMYVLRFLEVPEPAQE